MGKHPGDSIMHLIVVGGVAAGTKAAARARRVNTELAITLYQEESEVSYTGCGQPYYLSGVIPDRRSLIIRSAADFDKDGIRVRLRHRVTDLDTAAATARVHDLDADTCEVVGYDRLILATGAHAVVPPVPGTHLHGVVTLRTLAELDRFHSVLKERRPRRAVIVGGSYIGLEVAESLRTRDMGVTIVERMDRLLPRFDPELSRQLQDYVAAQGVDLLLGEGLAEITEDAGHVAGAVTSSGRTLPADLVVLAIGIKPKVDLAVRAGIALGATGAIAVDQRMETSAPGVFAAGDCAESLHRVTASPVWQPLGDIANLQGRVAGENAAGGNARFPGVLGTAIFKAFALNVGLTGLTETAAREAGFRTIATMVNAKDKARYFPGARDLCLKLVADADTGRLLGAQCLGTGSVDKMIDIAATALLGKLCCGDLENADLAYSPPFSPVLSPVILAASILNKQVHVHG
jgi:NADPH-dependent 2,4-dienoyl-CoA reductase/sulfur reductase-like enzyme